jgi:hypothetical protein
VDADCLLFDSFPPPTTSENLSQPPEDERQSDHMGLFNDGWEDPSTIHDELLPLDLERVTDSTDQRFDGEHSVTTMVDELPMSRKAQPHLLSSNYVRYTSYPFVEADNLDGLSQETIQFLETMNCFHLPKPAILDEFLQHYFLHVHPNIPMLDEGDFWEIYHGNAGKTRGGVIPLSLLQSMLFASTPVRPRHINPTALFDRLGPDVSF